ncbi:precorrin-6A/cobalt-precorrin-6A reductase [Oleiphilus sp. HI0132]|nr:precorrin-6A/cobalt-precorrin-6A reductase [Oleiphilus sp. HI0132]
MWDMTHPYAAKMSSTAIDVCNSLALPYWRFSREPWVARTSLSRVMSS